MDFPTLAQSFLLLVTSVAAAVSVRSARLSWPNGMRAMAKDLGERVELSEAKVESLQRKWTATLADLEAIETEIEGLLENVERKRKRAQTAANRAAAAEGGTGLGGPAGSPQRLDELRKIARAAGHQV